VDVLHDERERLFPAVALARLAHGTRGWVRPEGLVVGAAVVIAGQAEEDGAAEDEEGRREDQPARPPWGPRPEPGVRARSEQLRGVEGREVGAPVVVLTLEGGPGGVGDEGR